MMMVLLMLLLLLMMMMLLTLVPLSSENIINWLTLKLLPLNFYTDSSFPTKHVQQTYKNSAFNFTKAIFKLFDWLESLSIQSDCLKINLVSFTKYLTLATDGKIIFQPLAIYNNKGLPS